MLNYTLNHFPCEEQLEKFFCIYHAVPEEWTLKVNARWSSRGELVVGLPKSGSSYEEKGPAVVAAAGAAGARTAGPFPRLPPLPLPFPIRGTAGDFFVVVFFVFF